MAERLNPSRDLRFGLHALESGVLEPEALIAAIGAWARDRDRSLANVLADRGAIDIKILARLEDEAASAMGEARPADPGATVAYAGLPAGGAGARPDPPGADPVGSKSAVGRFQIIRPHARGGLGEIWVAFDRELKRSVAVKELLADLAHDPAAQARFLLEAEITGSLEHPGIVPVYSLGRYPDGRPFYSMHLVRGETLRGAIEQFHQDHEPAGSLADRELAFRRLLRCIIDSCNAVAYAHSRGVIHRDLKPDNIMLGPFGETLVVDWGLAKRINEGEQAASHSSDSHGQIGFDTSLTQPGTLIGTPRYMSPEQAAGKWDEVSAASDIYSLGAILYCALVGRDPFDDGDLPNVIGRVSRGIFPAPRRLLRTVDPALEAICLKAMALDPSDRHSTALELATELETWLADLRFRGEHAAALSQVKLTLARLCLERAQTCFDRETTAEGMLWLARALENAPTSPPELEHVIRSSLTGWHHGAKLVERTLRHGSAVHSLAFCPEGRRLATAGEDGLVQLWDLAAGGKLAKAMRHEGPVRDVAMSPDGTTLATASADGTIRRWDAWTGAPLGEAVRGLTVCALSFHPDGSMMAAPRGLGEPYVWHAATGKAVYKPERPTSKVLAIAFAPDGTKLAVAHDNGHVCLCETGGGKASGVPLVHSAAVSVLAFDERGEKLLTGSLDGAVRLWDLASRAELVTIAHQSAIRYAAFRAGGDSLATVDEAGTARLWDSGTGRPIGEPVARHSRVEALVFRPDGAMVATGSVDGTVRLWCAATGLPIGPPMVQGGSVVTLAFSPDGRRLASGGSDASVRCWKVPGPVEGTAERVSCWIGVVTELEFDAGDAIRKMEGTTSWELRRRLGEQGGAPLK